MEILHYIAGPLIGAVIGYFTNYIAVKMLFYPRREIRVFGHRLPFTPGAIPKGKARLAHAAGQVVSGSLMTKEVLTQRLLDGAIENEIADLVIRQLRGRVDEEIRLLSGMSEETYRERKEQVCALVSREIAQSVDVRPVIREKGAQYLMEHAHGTVLAVFLTEKRCASLAESIGNELQMQISEHGAEYVRPVVSEKIDSIDSQTASALLAQLGIGENTVRSAVIGAYRRIVEEHVETVLARLDIATVVSDKINAMSVEAVEGLVFAMMKKELNTIVSLGALIGFVLGLLNLFL